MKKIFLSIIILTTFSIPSFANIYIDPFIGYINAGDAKNQIGMGGYLGINLTTDITAVYRGTYSFKKETIEITPSDSKEKEYSHITQLFGIEYIPNIQMLKKFRLRWKNTVLGGYSNTTIDIEDIGDSSDRGFAYGIFTGLIWDLSQQACPFIEAGWHQSFYYNDFKDSDIQGFQVAIGFKFSIWPQQDIGRNY